MKEEGNGREDQNQVGGRRRCRAERDGHRQRDPERLSMTPRGHVTRFESRAMADHHASFPASMPKCK